ncbi:outer membrane protein assembly factor [Echinicola marina]|uniref:BamA/TamA family outer membrane protein n=1 Tax=Echinicola marina TaxID=2859768 RepID=UPI001CF6A2A8|nr:BamA/TamA family outer membrane protein [Echinicola marina]UCS94105.1 outer membrane protein assembly factor [Echinicola marina]
MKKGIITLLILLGAVFRVTFGQDSLSLKMIVRGGINHTELKGFSTEAAQAFFLKQYLVSLGNNGFLMADTVSVTKRGNVKEVLVETGQRYEWLYLSEGNIPLSILSRLGFNSKNFDHRPVNFEALRVLIDKIIGHYENHGYPFATVRLDSIAQEGKSFSANLHLSQGPLISFDSLRVVGSSDVNEAYLGRYLGIGPGKVYVQNKVDEVVRRLKLQKAFMISDNPQVSFQNSEATVYIPLKDRKVNTIDGIIGLLPNETEKSKMLVTGQFDLELFNVSGRGRNYGLHWQRLSQYSQNLRINAEEPMILGSGIDVKASFYLLKEDTTFINRNFRIDLGHQLSSSFYINFFSMRQSGDLLSVSVEQDESSTLPEVLDFRFNSYGAQLSFFALDNIYNPRRGWQASFESAVGNKKILMNTAIPESLYEGIDLAALQYYGEFSVENYWRWTSMLTAMIRLRAGKIAGNNVLKNDMFRLGGLRSIRGFNENFFFANQYVYANFEPRFYFENGSYFMGFVDVAVLVEDGLIGERSIDRPISFGGGLSLDTGQGAFQFILGVGRSNEQQLGMNYAKVHFGYTGRF